MELKTADNVLQNYKTGSQGKIIKGQFQRRGEDEMLQLIRKKGNEKTKVIIKLPMKRILTDSNNCSVIILLNPLDFFCTVIVTSTCHQKAGQICTLSGRYIANILYNMHKVSYQQDQIWRTS